MATPFPDIDRWSHLDHRIGTPDDPSGLSVAPTWLPPREWRRLNAYRFLDAVNKNSSRWYLEATDDKERDRFREFGDPNLFGDRIAAGVVGDQIDVLVEGAEHAPPITVPLPETPLPPDDGDPSAQAAYEAEMRVRAERSAVLIEDWERQWADYPGLVETQRWLKEWAHVEHFAAKVYEMEASNVVPLGDGVCTVQHDSAANRPTLTLYSPDAYFPVLDGVDDGRFPEKVHLAWEYVVDKPSGEEETWVRRITYELVDWTTWSPRYGGTANKMCLLSDGRWKIDQFDDRTINDLTSNAAVWSTNTDGVEMRDLPLGLDFIPLLHVPNGFSNLEHFGQSSLAQGIQVLEGLAQADTDAASASELAGTPQVAVSGTSVPSDMVLGGGVAWGLGEGGRMDTIDMSGALTAVVEYGKTLQERCERILKVPAGVLGRNANREIRSGVALQISNFPYDQEINKLRLTRAPKYRLLLKMVQRVAIAAGQGPPMVAPARVAFGSHLPSDLVSAVQNVSTLLTAQAISRATGLTMLVEAGLNLDAAESELRRILSEDTGGAANVMSATGSAELAAQHLQVDLPESDQEQEEPEGPEPFMGA